MNKIWYYTIDGDRQGPVSAADLKQLATEGKLKPDDLVWKEGMAEWAPAKNLKGLFPAGAESKPAPKPEPRQEEPPADEGDAFAGLDKGSSKKKPTRRDEEEEEAGEDDGDAFAGLDKKKGRSRRDEEEEDERPVRKSSRRDDDEQDDERDDYDDRKRSKKAPHRAGLVLTLGIVSLVSGLFCLGLIPLATGIPAIMVGRKDLAAMKAKKMDPTGEANTKIGYILGIVGLILGIIELIFLCFYFVLWGLFFGAVAGAGAGMGK